MVPALACVRFAVLLSYPLADASPLPQTLRVRRLLAIALFVRIVTAKVVASLSMPSRSSYRAYGYLPHSQSPVNPSLVQIPLQSRKMFTRLAKMGQYALAAAACV